jgi:hypothetical protein
MLTTASGFTSRPTPPATSQLLSSPANATTPPALSLLTGISSAAADCPSPRFSSPPSDLFQPFSYAAPCCCSRHQTSLSALSNCLLRESCFASVLAALAPAQRTRAMHPANRVADSSVSQLRLQIHAVVVTAGASRSSGQIAVAHVSCIEPPSRRPRIVSRDALSFIFSRCRAEAVGVSARFNILKRV